jgi:hypothetical protein
MPRQDLGSIDLVVATIEVAAASGACQVLKKIGFHRSHELAGIASQITAPSPVLLRLEGKDL